MKTLTLKSSDMGRFVEHQMRNWELTKAQRLSTETGARTGVCDFICIAREVGVGAVDIARLLAAKIGWPIFDKEILQAMAGDDALAGHIYASMDERDITWCEEVLRSFLDPKSFKGDFFHTLCNTVLSLARQGSAVFVGRGADLILPADLGLRVLLVAPLEMRVQNLARRLDVSEPEARRALIKLEEIRSEFLRRHFHTDVHDAQRYDLVINLRRMSAARAAELILEAREAINSTNTR